MTGREHGRAGAPLERVLVVRNDGLGDLILTLPLIASLKKQWPQCRVTVLMNAALAPLAPLLGDVEDIIADPGVLLKRHLSGVSPEVRRAGEATLIEEVRAGGFDAALLPYAESATARLVHRAGIPLRVGPLRRAFFWRFNRHVRQTRRGSDRAEFHLNLDYLTPLGLGTGYAPPTLLLGSGWSGNRPQSVGEYVVLHPHKRSGTALTWPLEHFVALGEGLNQAGYAVTVVGDEADRPVLEGAFAKHFWAQMAIGRPLTELGRLIAAAQLFVGNSSGPLHLAGLVGTPHVAFYPQDRVSAPARWRTLPTPGAPQAFRDYLLATTFPKACVACVGPRCPYYPCVASLTLADAWQAIAAWGLRVPETPGAEQHNPRQ